MNDFRKFCNINPNLLKNRQKRSTLREYVPNGGWKKAHIGYAKRVGTNGLPSMVSKQHVFSKVTG